MGCGEVAMKDYDINMSRRTFLAASGALAGMSPRVRAATNKNSRPTVAVVGCGNKGRNLSRTVAPFADMVACCDVDRNYADDVSLGKIPIYEDYRELLDREDIDAVINATPDHWHTAINVAALKAGVHVYCEKPLTLTIEEGKLLKKVVRETGMVLQVGTQQRSSLWFRRAIAISRSGLLGTPITATCHLGKGKAGGPFKATPVPAGLNWDFWLGQVPKTPFIKERCHHNFRFWHEYSGGQVTDWGAHHIDIAQYAVGAENTGPIEVKTEGSRDTREDCYNTAQTFDCVMKFLNGNELHVKSSGTNGITFEGENGTFFVSRRGIKGELIDRMTTEDNDRVDRTVAQLYDGRLGVPDEELPSDDRYVWRVANKSHMGNFFNCIEDGNDPIADVYTVHRTVSSCHLVNIALLAGKKLSWDPEKEVVTNDSKADGMLARTQREPYTIDV